MTSATETPSAAAARIVAERGKTYGHPYDDFTRTAALWTAILGDRLNDPLVATDVAQLMRLVKESRLAETPDHADSLIDLCGYADCQQMCVSRETDVQLQSNEWYAARAAAAAAPLIWPTPENTYQHKGPTFRGNAPVPGASVYLYNDSREWIVTDKMSPDGDMWRVSCGELMKTVELASIERVEA